MQNIYNKVEFVLMQQNHEYVLARYQRIIISILQKHQYKKIVLQIPKYLLNLSFHLLQRLQRKYLQKAFYVLYDSLKQSCCTDVLGAEHVGYDCLIHFGEACFSSHHQPNIYYIFQDLSQKQSQRLQQKLKSKNFKEIIYKNKIGYIIVEQRTYVLIRQLITILQLQIQVLRLPFDRQNDDQYLIFGYHISKNHDKTKNILIISQEQDRIDDQSMNFNEKLLFSIKSLSQKVGQTLFVLSQSQDESIKQYNVNFNKRLMQRYSLISSLQKFQVFGIIVSNTATSFFSDLLERSKLILKKNNKRYFMFMMNNLNEVKLGNFPQIQAYVIISCFNHSLFSKKDFQRVLITPNDLQIAFQNRQFDRYNFDMKSQEIKQQGLIKTQEKPVEIYDVVQVQNKSSTSMVLQNKIQTLTFYKQRQYKGLQFVEKKQIKKISKGKIGLAQQYTKLQ